MMVCLMPSIALHIDHRGDSEGRYEHFHADASAIHLNQGSGIGATDWEHSWQHLMEMELDPSSGFATHMAWYFEGYP